MMFPAIYRLGFRAGASLVGLFASARDAVGVSGGGNDGASALANLTWTGAYEWLRQWPIAYKDWWMNLVANDPVHVLVETTLIVSMIYMAILRGPSSNANGRKASKSEALTLAEEEDLLYDWKTFRRAPLVPDNDNDNGRESDDEDDDTNDDDDDGSADSDNTAKRRGSSLPMHAAKSKSKKKSKKSKHKSSDNSTSNAMASTNIVVHKQYGRYMQISTGSAKDAPKTTVLNFATFDFLGMQKPEHAPDLQPPNVAKESTTTTPSSSSLTPSIPFMRKRKPQKQPPASTEPTQSSQNPAKEASRKALEKYGVGSCGPRGFYGTVDAHLELEETIAEFTGTDGAVLYSDGASTCSSTVAAFAKRGDLLVVDEGVYEPLITGVVLSRANVQWFQHNDMEDLERILKQIQDTDKRLGRKPNAQRRFIVVEGLYKNLGTICPLDQLVALKHKYNYRLILDESFSFGTLGPTGRGALEMHGKKPMHDAEIVTIALENSLGSIGGVTVGNEEVVDHQRLSGAGYCFSASSPPFTAVAATAALKVMGNQPQLLRQLRENVSFAYRQLAAKSLPPPLIVSSDERSPIVVLQLEHAVPGESRMMRSIMRACLRRGVALVATGYEPGTLDTELAPALRITVSASHTIEDVEKAIEIVLEESKTVLQRNGVK